MLINEHTAISTTKTLLVPYSPHHVPTYHSWMESPSLRAATASEPLSLDQEHSMQQSWRKDADKLTFIICQPLLVTGPEPAPAQAPALPQLALPPKAHDSEKQMVGDVNAFFSLSVSPSQTSPADPPRHLITAELELMIAPHPQRRQGLGRAALLTFMHYIFSHEEEIMDAVFAGQDEAGTAFSEEESAGRAKLESELELEIVAKIGKENEASLKLFEGIGFMRKGEVNYFGEVELVLDLELDRGEQGHGQGEGRGVEWVKWQMKKFGIDGYRELRHGE